MIVGTSFVGLFSYTDLMFLLKMYWKYYLDPPHFPRHLGAAFMDEIIDA